MDSEASPASLSAPLLANHYVSPRALVKGDVSFGEGCVVLPYARIEIHGNGSLRFDRYCLIEEYAQILFTCTPRPDPTHSAASASGGPADPAKPLTTSSRLVCTPPVYEVGAFNHFHARCVVRDVGGGIGEGNVFHSFAELDGSGQPQCSVGDYSIFSPRVKVIRGKTEDSDVAVPSRSTVLASCASPHVTTPQLPQETTSSMGYAIVSRQGQRSVAELPSLADTLHALRQVAKDQTQPSLSSSALSAPHPAVASTLSAGVGKEEHSSSPPPPPPQPQQPEDQGTAAHTESTEKTETKEDGGGGGDDDADEADAALSGRHTPPPPPPPPPLPSAASMDVSTALTPSTVTPVQQRVRSGEGGATDPHDEEKDDNAKSSTMAAVDPQPCVGRVLEEYEDAMRETVRKKCLFYLQLY